MTLPHRHRLPSGIDTAKSLSHDSTIVMLHGWLGNENVMWAFENVLPKNALIVSPRAPLKVSDGYGWFYKREHADFEDSLAKGLATLREFIQQLPNLYPIDIDKIYLMGFSQGAAMCYAFALADPQAVAGVIALAGFLPDTARAQITPNCLAHKPIFISHGTQDKEVPLSQAREAHEALTLSGATITYGEYETGHKLNVEGMRDLKAWLNLVVR